MSPTEIILTILIVLFTGGMALGSWVTLTTYKTSLILAAIVPKVEKLCKDIEKVKSTEFNFGLNQQKHESGIEENTRRINSLERSKI